MQQFNTIPNYIKSTRALGTLPNKSDIMRTEAKISVRATHVDWHYQIFSLALGTDGHTIYREAWMHLKMLSVRER